VVCGDYSWLKPGAVVIDVGINSVNDPTAKKGTMSLVVNNS
jgi:5,10-methylene-tetrahydrofolate dehydrogenase/methenyl tetrahydrofolate cyclohydrolase